MPFANKRFSFLREIGPTGHFQRPESEMLQSSQLLLYSFDNLHARKITGNVFPQTLIVDCIHFKNV